MLIHLILVASAGVEPATYSLGESRSIQLSYDTSYTPGFRKNNDFTAIQFEFT